MKTKAIAIGIASLCASSFALDCFGQVSHTVSSEVNKAASESLKIYREHGLPGLKGAVYECWRKPRDFCLYLDVAAQRIANTANRRDTPLDKYFYTSTALERALVWLSPNARRPESNIQYLYAVEQMIDSILSSHLEKATYSGQ